MINRQSTTTAGWKNRAVLPALALALLGLALPGSPSRAEGLEWPGKYEQPATLRGSVFSAKTRATSGCSASYIVRDGFDRLHLVYMDPDPDRASPQGTLRHAERNPAGVWRFTRLPAVPAAVLVSAQQCYPAVIRLKGEGGPLSDILVVTWIQKNYDGAGTLTSASLCAVKGTSSASGVTWGTSVRLADVGKTTKYPSTCAIGNGNLAIAYGDNEKEPYEEINDRAAVLRVDGRDMTAVETDLSGNQATRDVGIGVGPDGKFSVLAYELDVDGDPAQRYLVYRQSEDAGRTWSAARPISGAYDADSHRQDPSVQITAGQVFIAAHGAQNDRGIRVLRAERRTDRVGVTRLAFETVRWAMADGSYSDRPGDGFMPNMQLHQEAPSSPILLALTWRKTERAARDFEPARHQDVGLVWCSDARLPRPRLEQETPPYDDGWVRDPSGVLKPPPSEANPAHYNTNARALVGIDPKTGRPRIDLVWLHTRPWYGEGSPYEWDLRVVELLLLF